MTARTPPRLCILGSLNMDLVVRAPRFPAPGETILGGPFQAFPGGKGANQAVAAARQGAKVSMIGCVGDDPYAQEFRRVLGEAAVDLTHIATRSGTPTGVGIIIIDASPTAAAQNTIVVALGANAALTVAEVEAARPDIAAADLLLMQLETPIDTVARAAAIAHECGTTVMLNAAPASPVPPELLGSIDLLVVNEHEGAALCGRLPLDDARATADALATLGPPCVVLTLGARGAVASFRGKALTVPAFPVDAIDTVGAGDAFCAAFACRWADHLIGGGIDSVAVLDAICWGCAAGAIAATRHGAIPSLPTRAEVTALLKRRQPVGPS